MSTATLRRELALLRSSLNALKPSQSATLEINGTFQYRTLTGDTGETGGGHWYGQAGWGLR